MRLGFVIPVVAIALSGCGKDTTEPAANISVQQTKCPAKTAQIEIMDGSARTVCGCIEAPGTPLTLNQKLNCTVVAGTTVVFGFQGNQISHQILSRGTPAFASSPPFDPTDDMSAPAHAVKFDETGTYEYVDAYGSFPAGKITVL